ncbi:MAG: GDCCVxC domain-containing (seleno)protein [Rhodospirillaceae bacterium]
MTGAPLNFITTVECPMCGHHADERMPPDVVIEYYQCMECGQLLKPEPGDHCVFCSYGTQPCPDQQMRGR